MDGNVFRSKNSTVNEDIFPYMTFWAVNDDVSGKLYWYTLAQGSNFSNIEGDIQGLMVQKILRI